MNTVETEAAAAAVWSVHFSGRQDSGDTVKGPLYECSLLVPSSGAL